MNARDGHRYTDTRPITKQIRPFGGDPPFPCIQLQYDRTTGVGALLQFVQENGRILE